MADPIQQPFDIDEMQNWANECLAAAHDQGWIYRFLVSGEDGMSCQQS